MVLYEKKQSYSTRMPCEVRALGSRQYGLNSLKTAEPNRSHSIEVYPKVKRREKKKQNKKNPTTKTGQCREGTITENCGGWQEGSGRGFQWTRRMYASSVNA